MGLFCLEFEGIEVLGKEPIFSCIPQILLTFNFLEFRVSLGWVCGLGFSMNPKNLPTLNLHMIPSVLFSTYFVLFCFDFFDKKHWDFLKEKTSNSKFDKFF